jgi:hypothetical protein
VLPRRRRDRRLLGRALLHHRQAGAWRRCCSMCPTAAASALASPKVPADVDRGVLCAVAVLQSSSPSSTPSPRPRPRRRLLLGRARLVDSPRQGGNCPLLLNFAVLILLLIGFGDELCLFDIWKLPLFIELVDGGC